MVMLDVQVQMELLQMDLEDNETAMASFNVQVEELNGTVVLLQSQKTKAEGQLEDSLAQVPSPSVLSMRHNETMLMHVVALHMQVIRRI